MSSTIIYGFPESGPGQQLLKLGNSWGSAARIWTSLSARYFENESAWMTLGIMRKDTFWELYGDPRISRIERLVFELTFDKRLLLQTNWEEMAQMLEEFDKMHPVPIGSVNHLPAISDLLKTTKPPIKAVGFYWTTVGDNPWWICGSEDEDGRMFDLSLDSYHHYINFKS